MKSPIIFRVFKNNQIHFVKQFIDRDQIVIGNNAEAGNEVDINLEAAEVSPIHCLVEKRGLHYYVCDLGSTAGTYKNNEMVLDEVLSSGDEFVVGPFRIVFFQGVPKTTGTTTTTVQNSVAPSFSGIPAEGSLKAPIKPTAPPSPVSSSNQSTDMAPNAPSAVGEKKSILVELTKPEPQVEEAAPVISFEGLLPASNKPKISTAFVSQRNQAKQTLTIKKKSKGKKTFAPKSEYSSITEFIKPGQGGSIEVLISWKERVLNTHHFVPVGSFKMGPDEDIQVPLGAAPKGWSLIECQSGVFIKLTGEMKAEVHRADSVKTINDTSYRLQQNEVVFIKLTNGMSLAIRFAPRTTLVPLDSPTIISASEFTGILAAMIIAVLTSLVVSVMTPKNLNKEEDVQRVAQVIFNQLPVVKPPPVEQPKTPPTPPPQAQEKPKEQQKPPEPPKKVTEADKKQEVKTKGDPKRPQAQAQKAQQASRASEVKPKDPNQKTKMFTSTKQGSAIKTGEKAGANAQSKEPDVTNTGLLSAFGSGGARSKLDKAYSGSGELLGAGEKATGSSGFNENRNGGDDLGSRFKDTGAGGKGTATQGIAGVGTKGRGTGMNAFGSGNGFGDKDQVEVKPGGDGEEFVGSIDREAVRRAIRSAYAAFKACYDREYRKDTKLEGKVMIAFEIHEKGVARNAKVVSDKSTISNRAVEECVRARILTLRYPEPPTGTIAEVVYPFLFQGQK